MQRTLDTELDDYNAHVTRALAQGFTPLPFREFCMLAVKCNSR